MKNNPSRLLIKLVQGNPSEEFKDMLGVYKIINHSDWITGPEFKHSTDEGQKFFFCDHDKCWKFEQDCKTIMKWPKDGNIFNDESWSKLNGTATLNFGTEKFTLHITSF